MTRATMARMFVAPSGPDSTCMAGEEEIEGAGVIAEDWRKAGAGRPSKAEVVTFLNLLVRIITVLRALFADAGPERRRLWMQNPQIRLKCERPIDVVLSGKGEQVFDLLWGAYSGDVSL